MKNACKQLSKNYRNSSLKVFLNKYLSGALTSIKELYNERTINKGRFLAEISLTGIEGRLLGQTYWIKLINDSTFSSFLFIFDYVVPTAL